MRVARRERRGDLLLRHPQPGASEIEAIELLRVVAQRAVAAGGDVGDDGAHARFDVGRCLALGVEEGAKFFGKIGGAGVETDGHDVPCAQPCSDA